MICLFIDLGKHYGGAENYLINIIKNWVFEGNEAIVILRKKSKFSEVLKRCNLDIRIEEVDINISDILYIKRFIRSNNIDFININGINSGFFIRLTGTKIPIITTVHSDSNLDRIDKNIIIRKIFLMLENYNLKKSNKIIVVSPILKNILIDRRIKKDNIFMVNNGVEKFNYLYNDIRMNENQILKICYIGRLEKVKGCEYLIEALKYLKDLNYICDIYGDGIDKLNIENKIFKLNLTNNVFLKGFIKNVRQKISEYDVIVVPSLFEASPLIIPEAMNAKTLILCSNVGGMPYIIKNGVNGYLFESKNYFEISKILKYVYYNPKNQINLINEAYRDFELNYSAEVMIKKTFEIFYNFIER